MPSPGPAQPVRDTKPRPWPQVGAAAETGALRWRKASNVDSRTNRRTVNGSPHRLRWRQSIRRDVDAMKAKLGKKHFRQVQGATHSTTRRKSGAFLSQHEKSSKRSFQWIRWVAQVG